VERVVLNALAKECGSAARYLRFRRLALPSVRAGLAFSGEADPPLKMWRNALQLEAATRNVSVRAPPVKPERGGEQGLAELAPPFPSRRLRTLEGGALRRLTSNTPPAL